MPLTRVRCPSCRREIDWAGNPWRPFCSERCKLADLGSWATERYRIPGEETDSPSDDEAADDEGKKS